MHTQAKKRYMLILLAVLLLGGAMMVGVFRHPTVKDPIQSREPLYTEDSNTINPSWSRVQAPNFGFSMYYPPTWHLTNQTEGTTSTMMMQLGIQQAYSVSNFIHNTITNFLSVELTRESGETIKVVIFSSDTPFLRSEVLEQPWQNFEIPYGQVSGRDAVMISTYDPTTIVLCDGKHVAFIEANLKTSLVELRSILDTLVLNDEGVTTPPRHPSMINHIRTVSPAGYMTKVEYIDAWRLSSVTYSEGEKLLIGFTYDISTSRPLYRSAYFTIANRNQVTPTVETTQGLESLLSEIRFSTSTEKDSPADSFSDGMQVISTDHAISLTFPSSWQFHTNSENCFNSNWATTPLATTTSGRYFWAEALNRDMSKRVEICVVPGILAPIPPPDAHPTTNFFVPIEGTLNGLTGYIERHPTDMVQDSIYEKPYLLGGEAMGFRSIITHNELVLFIQEHGLNEETFMEFIRGISFPRKP